MSELTEEFIAEIIKKKIVRPAERRKNRLLRQYGTNLPAIKVIVLGASGLSVFVDNAGEIKEIVIPLKDQIDEYKTLIKKKKLRYLLHEESLLVDIYILGVGVLYTVSLSEYIFEEFL